MAFAAVETVANSRQRPGWFFRWGFLFVALIGIAGVVGTIYVRDRMNELPELRTVNIERRDLRITVGTTGTIEPEEIIEVGAEVSGKIVGFGQDLKYPSKSITVGSLVTKGAILVHLDNELYQIELQKAQAARRLAEAEVGSLETQLQQAKRTLERAERLRSTNSQSEFDKIVAAHDLARSQLAIGRARLEQASAAERHAEINLARTTIRAPVDGVVIDRRANLGQAVHAGTVGLFLLARNLDHMRVRASVSESDIGKVNVGQAVTFSVDARRDTILTGRVERILLNARVHSNFVTYDVLVTIDDPTVNLYPNMTADVEFEILKREQAWLVPTAALQWQPSAEQTEKSTPPIDHDGQAESDAGVVWVQTGKGTVRPVAVRVGIDDGVQSEVISEGFRNGMPIVVGTVKKTTLARIIPSVTTHR